ncbi:lipid-A-disaccharide synthase [Pseudovibrio exalbescens]|uniref:Lipid-A-disaccharide synthase n=1 Tax=Pseudovibrio exalbescens TaxID=197461 RepID=A0A1U7JFL7_9HYPH|nr:lipid-A-disaccharide synthase [Pseudovibrio exalbescens]OKL43533.1 lipid-A-disaccharide synthase [Pseudovibrio exalbescens]
MRQEPPLSVYIVVGEESGDQLGAELIRALRERTGRPLVVQGVGGERLSREGLQSLFPLQDIAVMGLSAVLARLPAIVKRVYQCVDDVIAKDPDVLLIIDSPDFTHNVAKRVRKKAPHIPIVDYVSPSVWAWRPGRARKMAAYVDHLLALLPFEPEVHRELGGPATTYVGHPLIERLDNLRPKDGERAPMSAQERTVLVLPGSRGSEVSRLMEPFGKAVARIAEAWPDAHFVMPAVAHQEARIRDALQSWAIQPEIVIGEPAKFAAFRKAHAALAASGTVSLELAISGVPMVVAYKLDWFFRRLKDIHRFIPIATVDSMVLPNLVLGRNVVPEYLDEDANGPALADRVISLLNQDSVARNLQVEAFNQLDRIMKLPDGESQAGKAAQILLTTAEKRHTA